MTKRKTKIEKKLEEIKFFTDSIISKYKGLIIAIWLINARETIKKEKELKHYANHKDEVIREHFKHIPAYLRDLLFRASRYYTRVPSSYIRLVQKLLAEYPHDVLFLVLNYDNLLESALERFNTKMFKFREINQYIDDNRKAKDVKLHG